MNATGAEAAYSKERVLRSFLRLYAILFALAFLLDDEFLAALLNGVFQIGAFQWGCLSVIALFVGMDALIGWSARLRALLTTDAALNSMLAGLAALAPIVVLELALRPFAHFPYKDASIYQRDPEIGWTMLPSIELEYGEVLVRTNSIGLRSPGIPATKSDEERRVLVLGDSVAFGLRLEKAESFPFVMEKRKRERSRVVVNVINSGVPGYCTLQQARWLRRHGEVLEPDIVILAFVLNDVIPNLTGTQMGDFGADDPTPFIRNTLWDSIQANSALIYFGKRIFHQLRFGRTLRESAIHQELLGVRGLVEQPDHPEIIEAWEATYACLDDILKQCESLNARFLLAVFPYKFQIDDPQTLSAPQNALRTWAETRNVADIDLLPLMVDELERRGVPADAFFMDDCHLTAEGSRWVGEVLAEILSGK